MQSSLVPDATDNNRFMILGLANGETIEPFRPGWIKRFFYFDFVYFTDWVFHIAYSYDKFN